MTRTGTQPFSVNVFFNVWEQRLGNHTPTAVPSGTLPPWLTLPTRPALSNSLASDVGVHLQSSPILEVIHVCVRFSGCSFRFALCLYKVFSVLPYLSAKYQWNVSAFKTPYGMWYSLICIGLCYRERYHFYYKSQLVLWTLITSYRVSYKQNI